MKMFVLLLSIVMCVLMLGCESQTAVMLECTSPLIQKGSGCCMDADRNGVCDIDEKKTEEHKEEVTAQTQNSTEEKIEVQTEQTTQQKGTIEDAEKTGRLFAEKWNSKQYSMMYAMLTSELKQKKSVEEFKTVMELEPLYKRLTEVSYAGIMMGDDTADLNINALTNIQNITVPGVTLIFEEGSWRVSAFPEIFEMNAFDAACSGYRNDNKYTTEDCAYDFSKKMNDAANCNNSGCHYLECLKATGQQTGAEAQARKCYFCQPTGQTINDCILNTAIRLDKISVCNIIDEDNYSDRYCTCYGGFAKSKNNQALCNLIANPDYKDVCVKGFKGEYC